MATNSAWYLYRRFIKHKRTLMRDIRWMAVNTTCKVYSRMSSIALIPYYACQTGASDIIRAINFEEAIPIYYNTYRLERKSFYIKLWKMLVKHKLWHQVYRFIIIFSQHRLSNYTLNWMMGYLIARDGALPLIKYIHYTIIPERPSLSLGNYSYMNRYICKTHFYKNLIWCCNNDVVIPSSGIRVIFGLFPPKKTTTEEFELIKVLVKQTPSENRGNCVIISNYIDLDIRLYLIRHGFSFCTRDLKLAMSNSEWPLVKAMLLRGGKLDDTSHTCHISLTPSENPELDRKWIRYFITYFTERAIEINYHQWLRNIMTDTNHTNTTFDTVIDILYKNGQLTEEFVCGMAQWWRWIEMVIDRYPITLHPDAKLRQNLLACAIWDGDFAVIRKLLALGANIKSKAVAKAMVRLEEYPKKDYVLIEYLNTFRSKAMEYV